MREGGLQQLGEEGFAFGGGIILYDIAGLVVVGEAEFEFSFDQNGADVDGFEVSGLGARLGEAGFDQGVGGQGGGEVFQPDGERGRVFHTRYIGLWGALGKGGECN